MSSVCAKSGNASAAEDGGCTAARAFPLVVLLMGIALAVSVFISRSDVRLCGVFFAVVGFFVIRIIVSSFADRKK